ncbi:MAG: hypothetical protein KGS72_18820 [Cyanobacteria bacterium REEB67]|nr:hypothetical protein [Cyanobacteria bacterium REEB67]
MRVRRQGGATLGLVAACVLLVIVIGVGFYFLSKIIGGGREVANATDAGALNVARLALKRGTVAVSSLSTSDQAEFGGLATSGQITLLNYNRLVAQAMMVAKNAENEGAPTNAKSNAIATANAVKAIGNSLKASLTASLASTAANSLGGDFNAIAGSNNTKMWNGSTVACVTPITQGYLKTGGSTNIIWDANTQNAFGAWAPAHATPDLSAGNNPNSADVLGASVGGGAQYMPGYVNNSFLSGSVVLAGIPVFPNTKPHLVDIGQFNSDLTKNAAFAADPNVPPNAFQTNARATEAKSGNLASSVACAVVGVLTNDYKASLPRGFVRISNGPDAVATNGSFGVPISDGTNDIFNNQLFNGSGITTNGSSGVFTTTPSYLSDWAQFNSRSGVYDNSNANTSNQSVMTSAGLTGAAWVAYNVNPAGTAYPAGTFVPIADLPTSPVNLQDMAAHPNNYDAGEGGLRAGSNCAAPYATVAQLESIGGGSFPCVYTMYDNGLTGPCATVSTIQQWQSNYSCTGLTTGGLVATSGANQGVTNVEYMKAELLAKINGRLGGSFCSDVSIPSTKPSGVKYFSRGVPGTSSGPGGSAVAFDPSMGGSSPVVNFEVVGSPLQYLTQISNNLGSCAVGSSSAILEQITARMQQIESSVTLAQVKTALGSQQLHLQGGSFSSDNGTLYLYVDPTTHNVQMAHNLPAGWTDTTTTNSNFPDGNAPSVGSGECTETYPLNGWVVDTTAGMSGTGKGDAHYHAEPFTQPGFASGPPSYNGADMGASVDNGGSAPIYGQDAAIFKPSSGSQNILGELKFQENTQGTTFCKPN